jgi:hypothetical protein
MGLSNAIKTMAMISLSVFAWSIVGQPSSENAPQPPQGPSSPSATVSQDKPAVKPAKPAVVPKVKSPAPAALSKDTLIITARLIEVPGKFPPNDLYNYVFIMKYRVVKVLKGAYVPREILVGHYNPLIPRKQLKGPMANLVKGDISGFEVNALHTLVLIKPIEGVWKDAVEDDYPDSDLEKYFALKADAVK